MHACSITYIKAGKSVNLAETDAPKGGNGIGINSVCFPVAMTTTDTRVVAISKTLNTTSTTTNSLVGVPTLVAFSGSEASVSTGEPSGLIVDAMDINLSVAKK